MTEKIEVARKIRIGADRLRKIAGCAADAEYAAKMTRIAQEMDEHATELERSVMNRQPRIAVA